MKVNKRKALTSYIPYIRIDITYDENENVIAYSITDEQTTEKASKNEVDRLLNKFNFEFEEIWEYSANGVHYTNSRHYERKSDKKCRCYWEKASDGTQTFYDVDSDKITKTISPDGFETVYKNGRRYKEYLNGEEMFTYKDIFNDDDDDVFMYDDDDNDDFMYDDDDDDDF